mmetsp:Transcript_87370/g.187354  ORF Transcript_87370/g.187354 Transcript_87370/m.187354 type:complete len:263 (-) Transcript_87370:99-887(-)
MDRLLAPIPDGGIFSSSTGVGASVWFRTCNGEKGEASVGLSASLCDDCAERHKRPVRAEGARKLMRLEAARDPATELLADVIARSCIAVSGKVHTSGGTSGLAPEEHRVDGVRVERIPPFSGPACAAQREGTVPEVDGRAGLEGTSASRVGTARVAREFAESLLCGLLFPGISALVSSVTVSLSPAPRTNGSPVGCSTMGNTLSKDSVCAEFLVVDLDFQGFILLAFGDLHAPRLCIPPAPSKASADWSLHGPTISNNSQKH